MKNAKIICFLLLIILFLLVSIIILDKPGNTSVGVNIKSTKAEIHKGDISTTTLHSSNSDNLNLLVSKINTNDIVNRIDEKPIAVVNSTLKEYGIEVKNSILDDTEKREGIISAHLYHFKLQYTSKNIDLIEMVLPATGLSYLIFEEDKSNITYMGNINLPGRNLNYEPDFRIEEDVNSKRAWLVFKELNAYGTGIIEFDDVWYGIRNNGISEDLRYITQKSDWGSPNQLAYITINGTISEIKPFYLLTDSPDGFYIDVNYEIKFTNSNANELENPDDAFLFSANRRVRYTWNNQGECFTLDKENSEGDETLFDFNKRSLLKNYSQEVDRLSKSEIKNKKDWLKKFHDSKMD